MRYSSLDSLRARVGLDFIAGSIRDLRSASPIAVPLLLIVFLDTACTNSVQLCPPSNKVAPESSIMVSYNRLAASPQDVTNLAKKTCAIEGGKPIFVEHIYLECSILLPVTAIFRCS